MTHGSLFSGIGGFDLAAEWMGWENIFHCEINEFGKNILKYYWPKAISYDDITKTDFTIHRGKIDILTGGFPCQPYSVAGKRKGKEDERHLWPEMLRAIREIHPRWILGENVFGIVNWSGGLVFEEVQTDLEAEGYEVQAYVLPACAKNAPHRRYRIWFVAYTSNKRCNNRSDNRQERHIQNDIGITQKDKSKGNGWECGISKACTIDANTNNERLQGREEAGNITSIWENRNEQPKRLPHLSKWENFPTQSSICGRDDGVSDRVDRIKALGNAIVPQIAHEIFKAIEKYNELNK